MSDSMPPEFWQAIAEFNQGEFYTCHDTLEALWIEASDPPRSLYQGILQIAVACYHLSNRNVRGAIILLGEGINRLRPYQPDYAGLDITQLMIDSGELLTQLQQWSLESFPPNPESTQESTQSTRQPGNQPDARELNQQFSAGSDRPLRLPQIHLVGTETP